MIVASTSRMALPLMALVLAGGTALAVGIQYVRRQPHADITVPTASRAVPEPSSGTREQGQAALSAAQAGLNAAAAALAGPSPLSESKDGEPTFDIARIEPTGEAVIAGRAAAGAAVELLRDGELHDRAVADQSGQFTMVPPRLPPGTYGLTLRSTQPDGKQMTSKQRVAVALAPSPNDRPVMAMTMPDKSNVVPSQPVTPKDVAAAKQPQLAAAVSTVSPDRGLPSAVVAPKIATATVSRGDSLWRISRITYGVGMRYAAIYQANRKQIRNPNLIYPGQTIIVPTR